MLVGKSSSKRFSSMSDTKEHLKSYLHYPKGWDSYEGLPLRKDVCDLVHVILSFLKSKNIPDPRIVIRSGGTVSLEWSRNDRRMRIDISSGESIAIFDEFPSLDYVATYEAKKRLPESLSALFYWFRTEDTQN